MCCKYVWLVAIYLCRYACKVSVPSTMLWWIRLFNTYTWQYLKTKHKRHTLTVHDNLITLYDTISTWSIPFSCYSFLKRDGHSLMLILITLTELHTWVDEWVCCMRESYSNTRSHQTVPLLYIESSSQNEYRHV